MQTRPCGPTDARRYATLTRDVARRCGLTAQVFRQKLSATARKVDKHFARGQHHRIFKGKWFATVLSDDIDRIMAGRPYDNSRLGSRLTSSVTTTLDFTEPWADHFRNPIRNVIAML